MIKKKKARLIIYFLLLISLSGFLYSIVSDRDKNFQFGVIADCQYCSDPGTGVRKYALSEEKLKQCVNHLNTMNLEYVVHLGDFIDRDFESFDVVTPIYEQLQAPKYHVLGNHDFSVVDEKKKDVVKTMGLPSEYYDFQVKDWRFIVLNGNDISFHAHPENSTKYKEAEHYYEKNGIKSPKWNGALGEKQLSWLVGVLEDACKNSEQVVLYCHFPIYPDDPHNLWNATEVVSLIETYSCVKAYINGHNHKGNYAIKNGIHYLTLKGMVDTEETAYATIQVMDGQLKVRGFGRENDRVLEIR